MQKSCDYLVIGTGVAGLAFALKMAEQGSVILVAKSQTSATNTNWAQGGIASVQAKEDHFENHITDTLRAGDGLCEEAIVRKVITQAPERINELVNWGVIFDKIPGGDSQAIELNLEGGHSHRRILHVQDQTGKAIQTALTLKAQAHPNIEIIENHMAVDIITSHNLAPRETGQLRCQGAYFLDFKNQQVLNIFARVTALATGGAGKVYLYTSNWDGATGDGMAMAYRAGARLANMEFVQFHPTCLYHPKHRNFLISEALRGEGAELVNKKGEKFTYLYDPRGPLAPRDIVARAIDAEMKASGDECVFLDIRHQGKTFLEKRFPIIYSQCLALGFDLAKDRLPVVPAAHYCCGGILTDEFGRTDIPGLFAVGECAYTGLHGANRLASNSLLECLSFAHFASEYLKQQREDYPPPSPVDFQHNLRLTTENREWMMLISHLWDEIRTCMWNYVGIVRSDRRLNRAKRRLGYIRQEIEEYYQNFKVHPDIIELRNLATVAQLNVEGAIQRRHSVGTHYNIDHPVERSHLPAINILDKLIFHE